MPEIDDPFADEVVETIHLQRPHLDFAGEKLRASWMRALLAGELETKPRPGLVARMPAFSAQSAFLAEGLAAEHGYPPAEEVEPEVDLTLAKTGEELALSEAMFRCNSCHGVGDTEPLAGADTETINFVHIPERLRRGYYDRFTKDPQRVLPGTQMPQYVVEDGQSTISNVLDGDANQQFDAIWQFMRTLE